MFENHINPDGSAYLTEVLFTDIRPYTWFIHRTSVDIFILSRMHTTGFIHGFRRPENGTIATFKSYCYTLFCKLQELFY